MKSIFLFQKKLGKKIDNIPSDLSSLKGDSLLWVDVSREPEMLKDLAKRLKLDKDVAQSVEGLKTESKSKVEPRIIQGKHSMFLTVLAPSDTAKKVNPIVCVVGKNWVITSHQSNAPIIDKFKGPVSGWGNVEKLNGLSFLATLLMWIIQDYVDAFEAIETKLESFDVNTLRGDWGQSKTKINTLIKYHQQIGKLRRALVSHREPFMALSNAQFTRISGTDSADLFKNLLDRIDNAYQAAGAARDMVISSFAMLNAVNDHRTNDIVKTLTIVSILLLPGALIAGVMGMNFKVGLFGSPDNFWLAIALILLIMIAGGLYARARDWF